MKSVSNKKLQNVSGRGVVVANKTTTPKLDAYFYGYKTYIKISHGDQIDLIDFEGHLKDLPNYDGKNFAIRYLTPTTHFAVCKIDIDSDTEEKHFTCMLNESKQSGKITKKLNSLNAASRERARQLREARLKAQQADEFIHSNGRSSSSRSKKRQNRPASSSPSTHLHHS